MFFSSLISSLSIESWIMIGLGVVVLISLFMMFMLSRRISKLLGPNATSIEQHINELRGTLKSVQTFNKHVEEHLVSVERRLRNSVQAVETIRFNAYKGDGSGGNQSFATALLSEEGNGVIISSMYSRDHVSVFAKPVKDRAATYELSDEEKQALDLSAKKVRQVASGESHA